MSGCCGRCCWYPACMPLAHLDVSCSFRGRLPRTASAPYPRRMCPCLAGELSLSAGQARSAEALGLQRPTFNKRESARVVSAPQALALGCGSSGIRFPQPFSRPRAGVSPVVHSGSPPQRCTLYWPSSSTVLLSHRLAWAF